jgi:hypothetical protein
MNFIANAQSEATRPVTAAPTAKENKIKQKQQKEQDFNDAITAININADQQATLRDLFKSSDQELRDLKGNTTLTQEQRDAKKAEILSTRSAKLKKILGEEKFKLWNSIRNKQKAAANSNESNAPATNEQ